MPRSLLKCECASAHTCVHNVFRAADSADGDFSRVYCLVEEPEATSHTQYAREGTRLAGKFNLPSEKFCSEALILPCVAAAREWEVGAVCSFLYIWC
jgi:hypothetical protein